MTEEQVKKGAKAMLRNMLDADSVQNYGGRMQVREVVGVRIEMLFLDEKGDKKVFGMGQGDIKLP